MTIMENSIYLLIDWVQRDTLNNYALEQFVFESMRQNYLDLILNNNHGLMHDRPFDEPVRNSNYIAIIFRIFTNRKLPAGTNIMTFNYKGRLLKMKELLKKELKANEAKLFTMTGNYLNAQ